MSEITKALKILSEEKGLDPDVVMEAVQTALGAAYRKDFGSRQGNYEVKFDPETGDMEVWDIKEVVEDIAEDILEEAQEKMTELREKARAEDRELTEEEIEGIPQFNPKTQLMLAEAKEVQKKARVGETLRIPQEVPGDFGRMAAQTAKQVIIQKIREAERNNVFEDFQGQEGQVVQGVIHRRGRSGDILVDLGKITGVLPQDEQTRKDFYKPGNRMQFYVMSVAMGARGPEIMLSRSSNKMIESVFNQEIPEIAEGSVVIKAIARDPGERSKVAVHTDDESIDPIGACIGQRGSRITTIIDELGGEKIDVIQWNDDTHQFIKQALSPAKVEDVELKEEGEEKEAIAKLKEDQFSLAIGRGGQNVRLASDLVGWRIKVVQVDDEGNIVEQEKKEDKEPAAEGESEEKTSEEKTEEKDGDPSETASPQDGESKEKEEVKDEKSEAEEEVKEESVDDSKDEAPAEVEEKKEEEEKTEK